MSMFASTPALVFTPPVEASEAASDPAAVLATALEDGYRLEHTGDQELTATHLDTADRRLAGAGVDLAYVDPAQEFVLARTEGLQTQRAPAPKWPALLGDLEPGPVRDLLRRPVWIRALVPYASSRAHGQSFAVRNADDKIVVRLTWWDSAMTSPQRSTLPTRVQIQRLRGYDRDATAVERRLTTAAPLTRSRAGWWADLHAHTAPGPSTDPGVGIHAGQPAELAVAEALLAALADIEANVDGVLVGVDTEHLHEFRVAVRRTRSILKLLGDVLPDGLAARMAAEFRWLGDVTTPTRDLDVYLLGIDELAAQATNPADLGAFGDYVRAKRAAAQKALARALRSARFTALRSEWRAELAGVVAAPGTSADTSVGTNAGTAEQLADARIRTAFGKAAKRAKAITTDSPSEQVHSLRKACKEVRYLLEVFRPLCRPAAYKKVIADFKELQDLLGEFQDGEVQAAALREFAQDMINGGQVRADAILAMGELSAKFDARQRRARTELDAHHGAYLGKQAAGHIDRLVRTTAVKP